MFKQMTEMLAQDLYDFSSHSIISVIDRSIKVFVNHLSIKI